MERSEMTDEYERRATIADRSRKGAQRHREKARAVLAGLLSDALAALDSAAGWYAAADVDPAVRERLMASQQNAEAAFHLVAPDRELTYD